MNNFFKVIGAILEGVGEAAQEANRLQAEQKRKERERAQEITITVNNPVQRPQASTYARTVSTYQPQGQRKVTYLYSMESLHSMTTDELRNEVKSIMNETNSFFASAEESALHNEAFQLFYHTDRNRGSARYRAKLQKFLYEKGNI